LLRPAGRCQLRAVQIAWFIGDPCTPLPVCDRVRKIGLLFLCCIRNYDPKTAAQGSAPTAGSRGKYQTTRKASAWQVKILLFDYYGVLDLDCLSEQVRRLEQDGIDVTEQKAVGDTASVVMASRWPPKMLPEGSSTFVDPDIIGGCRLFRQRRLQSADQ
jgi:hypothetical protein